MSDRLRGIQEELEGTNIQQLVDDGVVEKIFAGDFKDNLCLMPENGKLNIYGSEFDFKDDDIDKPIYDPVFEKLYMLFQKIPQVGKIEVYDDNGKMQRLKYTPGGMLRKQINSAEIFDPKQKQE